jgi:hypothetical protein
LRGKATFAKIYGYTSGFDPADKIKALGRRQNLEIAYQVFQERSQFNLVRIQLEPGFRFGVV